MTVSIGATHAVIFGSSAIGLVWAFLQYKIIAATEVVSAESSSGASSGTASEKKGDVFIDY
jgi:hypothetical protein